MLVTLHKEHHNIDIKNKKLLTNQFKRITKDSSHSACISQQLRYHYEDSQSPEQMDQKYLNLKKNNIHSIKYIKKIEKQNIFENLKGQISQKQNFLKYEQKSKYHQHFRQNSTRCNFSRNRLIDLSHISKDYPLSNADDKFGSNFSTQANSRQKSRATSLQSSICCNMLKCVKQSQKQWKQVKKNSNKKEKKSRLIQSPDITKVVRIIMMDWLFELSSQIQLPKQALYNSIDYVDKFVKLKTVTKRQYQQVGLTCLFLASKLETSGHPSIQLFSDQMNNQISCSNIIEIERSVVNTLKFKLNPPTMYQYMTLLIFTMKSYKNLYKNIQWITNLPTIQKENEIYIKLLWIMDGVIIQGQLINKFQKQDLCLSIMYITIIDFMANQHSKKGLLTLENARLNSISQEKLSSEFQREKKNFDKSYEHFMSYATTTNKVLNDLQSCFQLLTKWIKHQCICSPDDGYHDELKQIALLK